VEIVNGNRKFEYPSSKNKDRLSLTNPRNAMHRGERAANKCGGRSV